MLKYVIYTDLDGTLLDHESYSFSAALPALNLAQSLGVPVVPATSKTRSEIESLRKAIPLNSPFIVENGAAIFVPKNYETLSINIDDDYQESGNYFVKAFSLQRSQWQIIIHDLLVQMPNCFRPFSAMSSQEIADLTGLTLADAELANDRDFSDPLLWFGDDEQLTELTRLCALHQVDVVKGGRFVHLIKGANKGKAVQSLHKTYKEKTAQDTMKSIVLGDGGNDIAMLDIADVAVCIRSKSHDFPAVSNSNVIYTNEFGPEGWCRSVSSLLKQ